MLTKSNLFRFMIKYYDDMKIIIVIFNKCCINTIYRLIMGKLIVEEK